MLLLLFYFIWIENNNPNVYRTNTTMVNFALNGMKLSLELNCYSSIFGVNASNYGGKRQTSMSKSSTGCMFLNTFRFKKCLYLDQWKL